MRSIIKKECFLIAIFILLLPVVTNADNSNFWPVHKDTNIGYRISYPPSWKLGPLKGKNILFSVYPPTAPGNCNVLANPNSESVGMSQRELNSALQSLPVDQEGWAYYLGLPPASVKVIESDHGGLQGVYFHLGDIETTLSNLQGPYLRRQFVAIALTPGYLWSINCGASSFNVEEVRTRFAELENEFSKIIGSFSFLGQ